MVLRLPFDYGAHKSCIDLHLLIAYYCVESIIGPAPIHLETAQVALYRSKANGGNQIENIKENQCNRNHLSGFAQDVVLLPSPRAPLAAGKSRRTRY